MKTIAIVATSLFALAGVAMAQTAPAPSAPAPPKTRAEVQAQVKARFDRADSNRDGILTRAEFDAQREKMRAERQAGMKARQDARFARLDANKDGTISKAEFDAGHQAMREGRDARGGDGAKGPRHGMMRGHRGPGMAFGGFEAMDANKDGKVSLAEASARPLAMFDRMDANKDGTITPEERRATMQAMRAEWKAKPRN